MAVKPTTLQVEKFIDGKRTITAQVPFGSRASAVRHFREMQETTARFYTGEAKRHANALNRHGWEMVLTRDGEFIDYRLV